MGLINAVNCGFEILVIVLDNRVAAMTGGQDAPDLLDVVKALVPQTTVLDLDDSIKSRGLPAAKDELENIIHEKMKDRGVSVLYIKGKCIKF